MIVTVTARYEPCVDRDRQQPVMTYALTVDGEPVWSIDGRTVSQLGWQGPSRSSTATCDHDWEVEAIHSMDSIAPVAHVRFCRKCGA